MTKSNADENSEIRIGISACLLGKKVRFDAGHKHDRFVADRLGQFVKFVSVCPEVEVGMGVPREAVRLVGDPEAPRMVGNKTGEDWTDRMNDYLQKRVKQKRLQNLSGCILKNRSPSCGMERVKVYIKPDTVRRKGVGLFAKALMTQFPDLPIEEEGRLSDPGLRENFIERIFAYHRLQQLYARPFTRQRMVAFHTAHKYQMLAHSPKHYTELGRLVARIKGTPVGEFRDEYRSLFMAGLRLKATVKKNVNVLQHIAGFLKNQASVSDRRDIALAIADYQKGLVPLIVPITLLRHFVRRYEIEYIRNQYYLDPHPKELMLRNHV
jgi:uncharacterized protein YbgA (DUF1722 family)/uncharacterized protein YbbK (DUF523 family)